MHTRFLNARRIVKRCITPVCIALACMALFVAITVSAKPAHAQSAEQQAGAQAEPPGHIFLPQTLFRQSPGASPPLPNARIAVGWLHICAINRAGHVFCWGDNSWGQLGIDVLNGDSPSGQPVFIQGIHGRVHSLTAGQFHTCAATEADEVFCWGSYFGHIPIHISEIQGEVRSMASAEDSSCVLTDEQWVTCFNAGNWFGANRNVTQISADELGDRILDIGLMYHGKLCILLDEGSVFCEEPFQWHEDRECRQDLAHPYIAMCGAQFYQPHSETTVAPLNSQVRALSTGEHACALDEAGEVLCWGPNNFGQLGNGIYELEWHFVFPPVSAQGLEEPVRAVYTGFGHTCAVVENGKIFCWGRNDSGQVGIGKAFQRQLTPTAVQDLPGPTQMLAIGPSSTCGLFAGTKVMCWGQGSMGHGSATVRPTVIQPSPEHVQGFDNRIVSVSTGESHTCATTETGDVLCWGGNRWGQLGDGTTEYRITPMPVTGLNQEVQYTVSGSIHTCALTGSGRVFCWGNNTSQQLGNDSPNKALDLSMLPLAVQIPGNNVLSIVAGRSHTCALNDAGQIYCWGSNAYGELGDGTFSTRDRPVKVVGVDAGFSALVSAGHQHTCALGQAEELLCWGNIRPLAANVPVNAGIIDSELRMIVTGADHACGKTAVGGVLCWGANRFGQLGRGNLSEDIHAPGQVPNLATGVKTLSSQAGTFTCAHTQSDDVFCWGDNYVGQIGDGTFGNNYPYRSTPQLVARLEGQVNSISTSENHACAVVDSGELYCWGSNYKGQVGTNPGWLPVEVLLP